MPKFKDVVVRSAQEGKPLIGVEEVINFLQENNKYVDEKNKRESIRTIISSFLNILKEASKRSNTEVAKFLSENVLELYSKETNLKLFLEEGEFKRIKMKALRYYIESLENILSNALHRNGEEVIGIIDLLEINYGLHKTIRDEKLFEVESRMRELIEELNLSCLSLEVLLRIKDKIGKKPMKPMRSIGINKEELDKAIMKRGAEHIESLGYGNIDELRSLKESPLIPHELKKMVEKRIAKVIGEGLKKISNQFEKAGIEYIKDIDKKKS